MSLEAIKASVDALTTKTNETVAAVNSKISAIESTVESVQAVLKRPGFGGAANDNDVAGVLKLQRNAVAHFARTNDESKILEFKAMSSGSDPDGGYNVVQTYSASITKKLFDLSVIRQLSRVETITSGNTFVEPIDNSDVDAVWVGEKSSRPKTAGPTFGELTVPAFEIYANIPITQNLLDDAGYDLGSYIENKTTDKFSRTEGTSFVSGDGATKPRGFLTYDVSTDADSARTWNTLQYVVSGHATQVTADGIKNLAWSLRAPYRKNAKFLMNSNTASAIDKLKDGQGNYLWRPGMTAGAPNELFGYEVAIDEDMPDLAAGSLSIAFANWKLAYVIVDRLGVRFIRDQLTDKPNVLFYTYKRVGGGIANSQAIKLLKTSA